MVWCVMVFTTLPPHLPSADGHRHTHRVEAMGAEAWDSFSTDYVAVVKLLDELDALPDIAREWAESPRWTAAWTATAPRAW